MDKWIRKSKGTNEVITCGMRGHSHLTHFGQTSWEREEREEEKEKKRERESFRKRISTLSLNFPTIGPVVSGGARGKVYPHG